MTAPHFFAPSVALGALRLPSPEARHAARVLRVKPGEEITVSDGRGHVVRARVGDVTGGLEAEAFEEWTVEPLSPRLTVCPAVAKGDKIDLVVQKLTELGVAAIRPWFASRSIVKWDAAKRAAHAERWRAIAYEAAKQSRRAWLPEVAEPVDTPTVVGQTLVLHEGAADRLRSVELAVEITLVIGPEGGLDETEVAALAGSGAVAVSLGEQILRAETASIAGAAAVLALAGGLG